MFIKFLKKVFLKPIKIIEDDDFIKRLRSSVIGEGMLHEGNIYLIDYAIKNMPENGYVLEIGTYGGLSTNLILHLLEKHSKNNKMIGCDAWVYEGYRDYTGKVNKTIDGKNSITRTHHMQYIKDAFINATTLFHSKILPYTCHLKSDAFFEKWKNNEGLSDVFKRNIVLNNFISFAYIDGDHSYKQTKKDFENVSKYLVKGSFVLIDDSADFLKFGSVEFIKEVKSNPDFKLIHKNPNYLFERV